MTNLEVQAKRSADWVRPLRSACAVVGLVLWLGFLLPPFFTWARRYEFVQAIQYCVFAFWVPALLVIGAPWSRLRLASNESYAVTPSGERVTPLRLRLVDRWQLRRSNGSGQSRAIALGVTFTALAIFWRVAPIVDGLVRYPWLSIVEALSLLVVGGALFSDLVESPPIRPGAPRTHRIAISAIVMWAVWVVAYLDGMSHVSWYHAFHHVAGRGISQAADQQLSAGSIWAMTAATFLPIIFWNLMHWLESEEDPSDELYRLVREERTRGFFGTRES